MGQFRCLSCDYSEPIPKVTARAWLKVCPACGGTNIRVIEEKKIGLLRRLFGGKKDRRGETIPNGGSGCSPMLPEEQTPQTVVMICTEGPPLTDEGVVQRILAFDEVKSLIKGQTRVVTRGNVPVSEARSAEEQITQALASLVNQGIRLTNPEKMQQYDITDPTSGTVYRVTICPP